MKRVMALLLALVLTGMLPLACLAAQGDMSLSDAHAAAGDMVYLTVTLNEAVQGDTMGIEYFYDLTHLTALPQFCIWDADGLLTDFNDLNMGVWAANGRTELKGEVCTLAFRINSGVAFSETKVSCKLTVKNGAETVGIYEAEALVKVDCDHVYGAWADAGKVGHTRICGKCGRHQTQSHSWDQGSLVSGPGETGKQQKLYTCTACGKQRYEEYTPEPTEPEFDIPVVTAPPTTEPTRPTEPTHPPVEPTLPTEPEPTERPQRPTEPTRPVVTEPTDPARPTEPTRPQNPTEPSRPADPTRPTEADKPYRDYNEGGNEAGGGTLPMVVPNYGREDTTWPSEETAAGSEQPEQPSGDDGDSGFLGFLLMGIALAAGAGAYLVYKKR